MEELCLPENLYETATVLARYTNQYQIGDWVAYRAANGDLHWDTHCPTAPVGLAPVTVAELSTKPYSYSKVCGNGQCGNAAYPLRKRIGVIDHLVLSHILEADGWLLADSDHVRGTRHAGLLTYLRMLEQQDSNPNPVLAAAVEGLKPRMLDALEDPQAAILAFAEVLRDLEIRVPRLAESDTGMSPSTPFSEWLISEADVAHARACVRTRAEAKAGPTPSERRAWFDRVTRRRYWVRTEFLFALEKAYDYVVTADAIAPAGDGENLLLRIPALMVTETTAATLADYCAEVGPDDGYTPEEVRAALAAGAEPDNLPALVAGLRAADA